MFISLFTHVASLGAAAAAISLPSIGSDAPGSANAAGPRARRVLPPSRRAAGRPARAEEPSVECASVFVDRLADLPLEHWVAIGRRLLADEALRSQRSTALAILEATITANDLAVAAWFARDGVVTAAFYATSDVPRLTPAERRAFAAACAAAEDTAFAVIARDHLAECDFALLAAPFEQVVSSDDRARFSVL
jgi:hypothetical protein